MANPIKAAGWYQCVALAWTVVGCAQGPTNHQEPRKEIGFSEQSRLGFAVSDLADIDRPVTATLTWRGPSAGFDPAPATGSTTVNVVMSYDGGSVEEVGEPPWQVQAEMVLSVQTDDGSFHDTFSGLLSARAADEWADVGRLSELAGSFTVDGHPAGTFSYDAHMARDRGTLSGSVGADVETHQDLGGNGETGTATAFQAGTWSSEDGGMTAAP